MENTVRKSKSNLRRMDKFMFYNGEIKRFAGDASEQRARAFAEGRGHTQVVFHPDARCKGTLNCFLVLDYDAPKPEGGRIVALYHEDLEG